MQLKDKVAIITGGGRGIGKAIALGFASQGDNIFAAARTKSEVVSLAEKIRRTGRESFGITCDVTNQAQVKNLINETNTSNFWGERTAGYFHYTSGIYSIYQNKARLFSVQDSSLRHN